MKLGQHTISWSYTDLSAISVSNRNEEELSLDTKFCNLIVRGDSWEYKCTTMEEAVFKKL
jgi:hypothetical protein